jgi:hypothetical protein
MGRVSEQYLGVHAIFILLPQALLGVSRPGVGLERRRPFVSLAGRYSAHAGVGELVQRPVLDGYSIRAIGQLHATGGAISPLGGDAMRPPVRGKI